MKVKAADEAKGCIARRESFRWVDWRGIKSKTAEGVYGLFYRKVLQPTEYKVVLLLAVYEPRTAIWYTTEQHVAELRTHRLDVEDVRQVKWVNGIWLLQDAYKRGYPALVEARLLGHL